MSEDTIFVWEQTKLTQNVRPLMLCLHRSTTKLGPSCKILYFLGLVSGHETFVIRSQVSVYIDGRVWPSEKKKELAKLWQWLVADMQGWQLSHVSCMYIGMKREP